MFRASPRRFVHLFSALVPRAITPSTGPTLQPNEVQTAKDAMQERESLLNGIDLQSAIETLSKPIDARERRQLIQQFSDCVDQLRGELYKKDRTDAMTRLQLHEAIMAAGFYQRALNTMELKGESIRFVLNHYNFDVRRDVPITHQVHDSLLDNRETTKESEQLVRDLLLLERRLNGKYRLALTNGRRWLTLGLPLSDIKSETELRRVLDLPVVKEVGNFALSSADVDKMWMAFTVTPQAEEQPSFLEEAGLQKTLKDSDVLFVLRQRKPEKPVEWWDRMREILLRYWVLWFALWVSFFMVDEEVITLVALIFLKHRQTKILEEETRKAGGGKIYVASATGRSLN